MTKPLLEKGRGLVMVFPLCNKTAADVSRETFAAIFQQASVL
jgi:hypothetical protein